MPSPTFAWIGRRARPLHSVSSKRARHSQSYLDLRQIKIRTVALMPVKPITGVSCSSSHCDHPMASVITSAIAQLSVTVLTNWPQMLRRGLVLDLSVAFGKLAMVFAKAKAETSSMLWLYRLISRINENCEANQWQGWGQLSGMLIGMVCKDLQVDFRKSHILDTWDRDS